MGWELLATASVPGTTNELTLHRNEHEFVIRVGHILLMNSRMHGSEDALADVVCPRMPRRDDARVLVGGLGMGFTQAAALRNVGPKGEVVVAELVPEVVDWNRGPLGEAAGRPLDDPRTRVFVGDVADIMRREPGTFDAILIDIDNGPDGLSRLGNERLYQAPGLRDAHAALRPGGLLGVWSVGTEAAFTRRLHAAGFRSEEVTARGHGRRGARHVIWVAEKVDRPSARPERRPGSRSDRPRARRGSKRRT